MKWRFFYHYNKEHKRMTVHFKQKCHLVDDVECRVGCETKWNKQQPVLVMRGFAKEVEIINNRAIIK